MPPYEERMVRFLCCDSVPNHFTLDRYFLSSIIYLGTKQTRKELCEKPVDNKEISTLASYYRSFVSACRIFFLKRRSTCTAVPRSFLLPRKKKSDRVCVYYIVVYIYIPSEAMEQQTAGLRESSVIRKVVVFFRSFFVLHAHTHM